MTIISDPRLRQKFLFEKAKRQWGSIMPSKIQQSAMGLGSRYPLFENDFMQHGVCFQFEPVCVFCDFQNCAIRFVLFWCKFFKNRKIHMGSIVWASIETPCLYQLANPIILKIRRISLDLNKCLKHVTNLYEVTVRELIRIPWKISSAYESLFMQLKFLVRAQFNRFHFL